MTVSDTAPRFSMLAGLAQSHTSDERRELLRRATEVLDARGHAAAEQADIDELLAAAAEDYAAHVRAGIAELVAASPLFPRTANRLALDDIQVAEPVLKHAVTLTDETLLKVIEFKSQDHLMAVTKRRALGERVSHALVQRGDDHVVASLLGNAGADIGQTTYETIAVRAEDSRVLQAPLARRKDVPLELLTGLYLRVEAGLRREILEKFETVPQAELDMAFLRGRQHVRDTFRAVMKDFEAAKKRIAVLEKQGQLKPATLATLLREGMPSRPAFLVAFARLADVEIDLVERVVETRDLDTLALLCRGASLDRALYVTLALSLDGQGRAMAGAKELGDLYESVPVIAAQRALRFWKVRDAA